jgi:hypothetical protein
MDVGGGVLRGGAGLFCVSSVLAPPPEAAAVPTRVAPAREEERHWTAAEVSWSPHTMVVTPADAGEYNFSAVGAADDGAAQAHGGPEAPPQAQASAPQPQPPRRAPGVACCQVPGCTQSPSEMRAYNNRCRCAAGVARCSCPACGDLRTTAEPCPASGAPCSRAPPCLPRAAHRLCTPHMRADVVVLDGTRLRFCQK